MNARARNKVKSRLSAAEQALREDLFYANATPTSFPKQSTTVKETEMSKPSNMSALADSIKDVSELKQVTRSEALEEMSIPKDSIEVTTVTVEETITVSASTEEEVEVLDIVMAHDAKPAPEVAAPQLPPRGDSVPTVAIDDCPYLDAPNVPSAKEMLGATLDRLTAAAVVDFPMVVGKQIVNCLPRDLVYGETTMTIKFVPALKANETVDAERIEQFVRNELHRINMRMERPRDVLILPSDMAFSAAFLAVQNATYVPSKDGCPAHLKLDISHYNEVEESIDNAF